MSVPVPNTKELIDIVIKIDVLRKSDNRLYPVYEEMVNEVGNLDRIVDEVVARDIPSVMEQIRKSIESLTNIAARVGVIRAALSESLRLDIINVEEFEAAVNQLNDILYGSMYKVAELIGRYLDSWQRDLDECYEIREELAEQLQECEREKHF